MEGVIMKKDLTGLNKYLVKYGEDGGAWEFKNRTLRVIASWGFGWDHISISRQNCIPNYYEMKVVLKHFAERDEYWMQLYVPESEHVNCHPYCLHWWRPQNIMIPVPPSFLIGPK
jgi:hypothetical protein